MRNRTSNTGGKLIGKNTKLKHNFMNKKMYRARQKVPIILLIHRRRLTIQEGSSLFWATEGAGPTGA
jgi:hypothetical protein